MCITYSANFFLPDLTALLLWYKANKRDLPWRRDRNPYHVWISEIMLQQTRVEAVKGYYERFLRTLPDIPSLAQAPEDVYLKLWEGLGYYSRVRNLHRAAQIVTDEYDGQVPQTSLQLQKLPGVGAYTSAAIASIAFGEPAIAVDGNLLRIFARLTAYDRNIKEEKAKKAAEQFFLRILLEPGTVSAKDKAQSDLKQPDQSRPVQNRLQPAEDRSETAGSVPGDFNQALMDLGATVCLPNGEPLCEQCPWKEACAAYRIQEQTRYPVMPQKKTRKTEDKTVFLIHYTQKIAIRKRPDRGLLAGLYEFPMAEGHLEQDEAVEFVRCLGFSPLRIRALPPAKHIFTHKEWHMTGYDVLVDETLPAPDQALIIADMDALDRIYSIPSAFSAFRTRVMDG